MHAALLVAFALSSPVSIANERKVAPAEAEVIVYPAVPSTISEVVVYPGFAVVHRTATLPAEGGKFALQNMPRGIDAASLRVRADGGEVVGIEARERELPVEVPRERMDEVRTRVAEIEREIERADDRVALLTKFEKHLASLLTLSSDVLRREEVDARAPAEIWGDNFTFLTERMKENREEWRTAMWDRGDLVAVKTVMERIE